jgi:hypothetical protein
VDQEQPIKVMRVDTVKDLQTVVAVVHLLLGKMQTNEAVILAAMVVMEFHLL